MLAFSLFFITNWHIAHAADRSHSAKSQDSKVFAATHPIVRRSSFWKGRFNPDSPIEDRIKKAPQEFVKYLREDLHRLGYESQPVITEPSTSFKADIQAAVQEMPDAVKKLVAPKLVGIFLISGIKVSGYTTSVEDSSGRKVGAFVVLNLSALNKTANQWASWRENSPFSPDPSGFKLAAKIENDEQDNRKNALQYLLLHEFGHVVATGNSIHPEFTKTSNTDKDPAHFAFSAQSWKSKDNWYVSIFDKNFAGRSSIAYYADPENQIPFAYALPLYFDLEDTNFPTLYAATGPADDFAESFVSFVHTVLMKRPFQINLTKGNKIIKSFTPCWDHPRCKGKRDILEDMFH